MAAWKILGLVVTPTTFFSSISCCRVPEERRSRDRSSSQMDTPALESADVGLEAVEVEVGIVVLSLFAGD
jgi:hypothetical protein